MGPGPPVVAGRFLPAALPAAYDAAWRLALGPLRAAAFLDAASRRAAGKGFLPPRWLAERRLQAGPRPGAQDTPGPSGAPPGRGTGSHPPTLWMHAASLGESKGLWALAERLLGDASRPDGTRCRILLTVNTAEALEYLEGAAAARAGASPGADVPAVSVAPLDHPGLVASFLRIQNVVHVCLYEAEIWPNYIRASADRGIPVVLVSGRMTERALARYRLLQGALSGLLDRLDWIMAQGEPDAERFRSLTRTPVAAGPDFKASRYFKDAFPARQAAGGYALPGVPVPSSPPGSRLAFLSLHLAELDKFRPELPGLMARFPLTVFPRRPAEMAAFRKILEPLGFRLHSRDPGARHVMVDSLGRVPAVLPLCRSAFVGGSLVPLGCHNLWEPLLAGLKIYFGPSFHNQEGLARALLEKGLAETIDGPSGAAAWRDPEPGMASACREFALEQLRFLEESEAVFAARIGDAVSRFYLLSRQAKDR